MKLYGRMIRPKLRGADDPQLTSAGVDDPIGHMVDAFDHPESVDAALWVVTWAYYSLFALRAEAEVTYGDFMLDADDVFRVATPQEVAARHVRLELEDGSVEAMRMEFERLILALTLGAAIGPHEDRRGRPLHGLEAQP